MDAGGDSLVSLYTYPAWVALIAVLRGTDALDRTRMAALLLSFMGLSVMVGAPDAASWPPWAW